MAAPMAVRSVAVDDEVHSESKRFPLLADVSVVLANRTVAKDA